MNYLPKKQKGFGLIEILIVGSVIGIGFVGLVAFLVNSSGTTFKITRNTEAVSLAKEGMEAVRNMRDESWKLNIKDLLTSTTYYPEISGNKWTLTTTAPPLINGLYTRTVLIDSVDRDVNADIVPSGTLDDNTKRITVTVTWKENQKTEDVTIETYITNFLDN
ncbi:type II secretion system protein [Patescibacteria group bacterium]|nr:type II secretion system protein [Patescibacteria group bacterium]